MFANENMDKSPNHFMLLDAISKGLTNIDKIARATKLDNDEVSTSCISFYLFNKRFKSFSVFAWERLSEFQHVIHKLAPVDSHARVKFLHYITHLTPLPSVLSAHASHGPLPVSLLLPTLGALLFRQL